MKSPIIGLQGTFFELQGQKLDKSVFHWIYSRFEGHTWYMQAMLNRLYERNESVVDATQAEQVLMGLLKKIRLFIRI